MANLLKKIGLPLAAAGAIASQEANGAVVATTPFQDGDGITTTSTKMDYVLTNNDAGATYNNATFDLSSTIGEVVDAIVLHNDSYTTASQVYSAINPTIQSVGGDVSTGWAYSINPSNGLASITHGFGDADLDYDAWSNSRDMLVTLNFGNMLDFDGNGSIDANETLQYNGMANDAFIGYATNPGINWSANADKFNIASVPEPSSTALLGLGALALAGYRRRKD